MEPHKEGEYNATPLGCEPEKLVEEHATIVPLPEEVNMKNMDDQGSDFFRIHDYFQPYDSWKD